MDEKLITNRRAGWWIIAALCGLLAAAVLVGEARAHDVDTDSHDTGAWSEAICIAIDTPGVIETGVRDLCHYPSMKVIHKWRTCIGADKETDGFYPRIMSEHVREVEWIYKQVGSEKDRNKALLIWLDMQCQRKHSWRVFKEAMEGLR